MDEVVGGGVDGQIDGWRNDERGEKRIREIVEWMYAGLSTEGSVEKKRENMVQRLDKK